MNYKKYSIYIIAVFIIAISLRIFHFIQFNKSPIVLEGIPDVKSFIYYARLIAAGDFFFKEPTYHNIFYSYILCLFNFNLKLVVFSQLVIDSISSVLVVIITKRISNPRSGLIAGLLYACFGTLIFYSGLPLAEPFSIFLLLLSIQLFFTAIQQNRIEFHSFASGFLFALASLARPNIIISFPFILILFIYKFRKNWRYQLKKLLPLHIGMIVVLTPFALHNWFASDTFSPYSLQGGASFYIGNHSQATGSMKFIQGASREAESTAFSFVQRASELVGRPLSPKDANAFWFRKGLSFIKDEPLNAAKLYATKVLLFINAYELPLNTNYYFWKNYSYVLKLSFLSFGMFFSFAILSFFLVPNTNLELQMIKVLALSLSLSVIMFLVSARHRLVCVPFVIILASTFLDKIINYIQTRKKRQLLLSGCGLLILFVLSNLPIKFLGFDPEKVLALSHLQLGNNYANKNKLDHAIKEYEMAVELDPKVSFYHKTLGNTLETIGKDERALQVYNKALELKPKSASVLFRIGVIYYKKEEYEKAFIHFKKVELIKPEFSGIQNNLGATLIQMGKLKQAIYHFEKALQINPDDQDAKNNVIKARKILEYKDDVIFPLEEALRNDPDNAAAHSQLGVALLNSGQPEKAILHLEEALKIKPDYAIVHNNLGIALIQTGKTENAIEHFETAIRIKPDFTSARKNLEILQKQQEEQKGSNY